MDNSYLSKPAKTFITLLAGFSSVGIPLNGTLQQAYLSTASNERPAYYNYRSDTHLPEELEFDLTLECNPTYNEIVKKFVMYSNKDDLKIKLIALLKEDNDDENYFPSIEFINEKYLENQAECVNMIIDAFRHNNYAYAEKILGTVMFSDMDYLASWFKSLLLESKKVDSLKTYVEDIYEMYKEVFDTL